MITINEKPPQIIEIPSTGKSYRIAMPRLYYFQNKTTGYTSGNFVKLYDNVYSSFNICSNFKGSVSGSYFPVNENLTIKSFLQWHKLTKQNPGFLIEQFDPIYYAKWLDSSETMHISETTQQPLPRWLATNCRSSETTITISPPHARSVILDYWKCKYLRHLAFPKMAFVDFKFFKTNNHGKCWTNTFFCLIHTRGDDYVPFQIPSVNSLGMVCMGSYASAIDDYNPVDYFWNSVFMEFCRSFPINKDIRIPSSDHWQELTQRNPNFFQEKLDPDFVEQYSDVIYTIRGKEISWRFQ